MTNHIADVPPKAKRRKKKVGIAHCIEPSERLEVEPTTPESKPSYKSLDSIVSRQMGNDLFRSLGEPPPFPDADDIVVPERVRQMVMRNTNLAPSLFDQTRVVDSVNEGELVHGDLILTAHAHALSMIDTRTVPGCVYLRPFDRDEVLDFLRFQNIKLPRYRKPARMTEDQKFWFKMRFEGVPL
jgi:hypothetical protein